MATGTYLERIARLERQRDSLRAQLALVSPSSHEEAPAIAALLEYVTATLVVLCRRQAALLVKAAAVSKHAPCMARSTHRVSPLIKPQAARAVSLVAPGPAPLVHDDGVEFEAIWPLRDDPKAPPSALCGACR